jgi:hypothetical protein
VTPDTDERSGESKRQRALVLAASVGVHLGILGLAVLLPTRQILVPSIRGAINELIEVSVPQPEPPPAQGASGAAGRADSPRPGNARGDEGRSPLLLARRATLAAAPEPVADPLPLAAPVQDLGGPVGFGTDGDGIGGHGIGGFGPGGDGAGGDGDGRSPGVATDGWVAPDGCHNMRDDDGDHLIDWEDPECQPPPETPEEEVEQNTKAMLLSAMRANDLPRGDPDELARERIQAQLRAGGDGDVTYGGGGIKAAIGPDGDVRFGKARSVGLGNGGMSFDLSGVPRQRRGDRQKVAFLDATEDLRAEREEAARARDMSKALFRLRGELDEIWRDRRLTLLQKKAVLFERLDECDLETDGGRQAAKTIVAFIRAHSRAARADERPAVPTRGVGGSGSLAR